MSTLALLLAALALPPMSTNAKQSANLAAAAAASGRPKECSSGSRRALSRGPSVWEVARVPNLQKYCDLMGRASAELSSSPDKSREVALEADKLLPGHAAPEVLVARAALALEQADEAYKAFEKARAIDPRSVEDPSTMHDLARVLAKAGKREEALATYRALVPRIDLLGTTDRRVSVLLEAAFQSMADAAASKPAEAKSATKGAQPNVSLDEATAYLREARLRPPTQLAGDVLLALILVLDRSGEIEEADAALADAQRSGARLHSGSFDYLAAPEDKIALEALQAETFDRAAAQKLWEQYLASPAGKGAWGAAAKARLDSLRKGVVRGPKTSGARASKQAVGAKKAGKK